MNYAQFERCVDRLHGHMQQAISDFFDKEGIKPDWISFWQQTSIDHEQNAREILFFAGNLWPQDEQVKQSPGGVKKKPAKAGFSVTALP